MSSSSFELEWLITSRADLQRLLVQVLEFLKEHPQFDQPGSLERSSLLLLVGAGFSLWRAAFLVDASRDSASVPASARDLLTKVVSENTITFSDDRRMRDWTVGYYINNARYRINRLFHDKLAMTTEELAECEEFVNLHICGFDGETDCRRAWSACLAALERAFTTLCERLSQ